MSIDDSKNLTAEKIKEKAMKLFDTKTLLFNDKGVDVCEYQSFYKITTIKKLLNNVDLVTTAQTFFDNALNTSQASVNGFMHRNTMVYRLHKIKSLTGLDIRDFYDAVILNNIILFKQYIDSLTKVN